MRKTQPITRILVISREKDLDLTRRNVAVIDSELKSQSTIYVPDKAGTPEIVREINSRTIDLLLMQTLSVKGLAPNLHKKYEIEGIPSQGKLALPDSYWQGFSLIDHARRLREPIPVITAFDVASHLYKLQDAIYTALREQFGVSNVLRGGSSAEYLAEQIREVLKG
jgi:hypothetical protein